MIFAGIDAGSRAIKTVLMDENLRIVGSGVKDQGVNQVALAESLLDQTLEKLNFKRNDITYTVATGYGRDALEFPDTRITEITCHARGVRYLEPKVQTIIDIGGQDSKVIRLDSGGKVRDFVMNDRCAAGTGRFLEVIAHRLELDISDLGHVARDVQKPVAISSMCVVFAETEIIGLLASGETRENIVAGVQKSIASRIASMVGRHVAEPIIFTGGVAMIPGMEKALETALDHPVDVAKIPQMTGALGAALLASQQQ